MIGGNKVKFKTIHPFLLLLIFCTLAPLSPAADILHRLTHGDQYALVLGRVTQVQKLSFELSVARTVSGHRTPAHILINCSPKGQQDWPKPGEKLLVSLEREAKEYRIHWGLFHVSSLDPRQLKIIQSAWPKGDLAALEHYLHTGENDFFFVYDSAFARFPDGTFTRIYPALPAPQKSKHFKLMICPERREYRLTDSSTPGIGLEAIYFRNSQELKVTWETNYGRFILWEPPEYRVISMGKTAEVPGWKTVYWTPLTMGKDLPKEGIRIGVSVNDQKDKVKVEQAYIEVQFKEGTFRVRL